MPAGRPTDYQEAYVEQVYGHLSQGFTLASFGGIVSSSRDTLYEWAKVHPRFSDAIKRGRAAGQHKWEQRLSKQAETGDGNTAAIIFAMKNLYKDDWADRIVNEHTGPHGGAIQNQTFNIDPEKLKGMTDDELDALERVIGKLQRGHGGGESRTDDEGDAGSYASTLDGSE
jgi:hypothetical protein